MLSCHARAGNIGWEGARRPTRCTRNRCLSAQSECKRSLPCRPKQRPVPDHQQFSQSLIGNLSVVQAAWYMDNRARYGINTLWINLLCNDGTACNSNGTTVDDIAPLTRPAIWRRHIPSTSSV